MKNLMALIVLVSSVYAPVSAHANSACQDLFGSIDAKSNGISKAEPKKTDVKQLLEIYEKVNVRTRTLSAKQGDQTGSLKVTEWILKYGITMEEAFKTYDGLYKSVHDSDLVLKMMDLSYSSGKSVKEIKDMYDKVKGNGESPRGISTIRLVDMAVSFNKSIKEVNEAYEKAQRLRHSSSEIALDLSRLSLEFGKTQEEVIKVYNDAVRADELAGSYVSKFLPEEIPAYEIAYLSLKSGKSVSDLMKNYMEAVNAYHTKFSREIDPATVMHLFVMNILTNEKLSDIADRYDKFWTSTVWPQQREGNKSLAMKMTYVSLGIKDPSLKGGLKPIKKKEDDSFLGRLGF